ncbi:hypothetical protein KR222_003791 [Zaprionus bogoriensis]|nr:hypothetical protein KR222_003791 [Zaprionus bogoriensis]
MKLDNFRLSVEVGQRRALWDSTMQLAARKDVAAMQWQEVADVMQMGVEACKKRFKGLRDSYRSEIRKIQQGRIERSYWPYFRALEFMRGIFDPDRLVSFSPLAFNIDSDYPDGEPSRLDDFIIDVDNDDSFDFEIMGDIFKRDPSHDAHGHDSGSDMSFINKQTNDMSASNQSMPLNKSDVEMSPRLLSPLLPKAPPAKRARRRKTSSSTDGPYLNGHAPAAGKQHSADSAVKDDPDYNFLVSLLPHVKSLSSMNNMRFRTEVSRMLMDLNQQETEHAGAPPALPKLNLAAAAAAAAASAPASHSHSYTPEPELPKFSVHNGAHSAFVAHSSIIECDVKIENEPLF